MPRGYQPAILSWQYLRSPLTKCIVPLSMKNPARTSGSVFAMQYEPRERNVLIHQSIFIKL